MTKPYLPLAGFFLSSSVCFSAAAQQAPAPENGASPPSEETHELEGILVEGKLVRVDAPAASTAAAIDEEELERFEEDDVHQVLLKVPGVQIRGEDGVGLRPNIGIRGTSPNRSSKVTLMEDGVLLGPAPYSAPAAYYFPLITRMKAVEVYKGGAQLRFGPRAMGGAINLRTADIPRDFGLDLDVAGGQYGYFKAHARGGYGNEQTGFLLEGAHIQSSGFKDLDGGGNTGFGKNEFMAKWRLNSDPTAEIYHQLDVKLGFATEQSNETYLGLTQSDFDATPYRRYVASAPDQMNWTRGQSQITYSVLPSDDMELKATAYRHQFTRDWFKVDGLGGASLDEVLDNPSSPTNQVYYDVLTGRSDSSSAEEAVLYADNYRWYISQGIQTQLLADLQTGALDHEIDAGIRYHFDEVNRLHTRHTMMMSGASDGQLSRPTEVGIPTQRLAQNRGQTHAVSTHLIDTLQTGALTLTPGARLEFVWTSFEDMLIENVDQKQTQLGFLPGIGAHYAWTEELGTLMGVYRGFGPVAPEARVEGEAPPAPETSTTWELGARYSTGAAHAEVIGFFNHYGNLTANCSQSQGCSSEEVGRQFSGGKADVWGLESMLGYQARAANLSIPLRATYALTMSAFRSDFVSSNPEWGTVQSGDELPYVPRHQATLGAGVGDDDRWAVDASGTFVAASRETAGSGSLSETDSTDAYALVGLAAKVRVVSQLWIYANGSNLLDNAYLASRRPHGARPGAPRWLQVGLKFKH